MVLWPALPPDRGIPRHDSALREGELPLRLELRFLLREDSIGDGQPGKPDPGLAPPACYQASADRRICKHRAASHTPYFTYITFVLGIHFARERHRSDWRG